MNFLTIVFATPLLLIASAITYPRAAMVIIAELKRQLRLLVIQREGAREAQELAHMIRAWAAENGYHQETVQVFLEEHKQEIIDRLGTRRANEILGEPTPTERYS